MPDCMKDALRSRNRCDHRPRRSRIAGQVEFRFTFVRLRQYLAMSERTSKSRSTGMPEGRFLAPSTLPAADPDRARLERSARGSSFSFRLTNPQEM